MHTVISRNSAPRTPHLPLSTLLSNNSRLSISRRRTVNSMATLRPIHLNNPSIHPQTTQSLVAHQTLKHPSFGMYNNNRTPQLFSKSNNLISVPRDSNACYRFNSGRTCRLPCNFPHVCKHCSRPDHIGELCPHKTSTGFKP